MGNSDKEARGSAEKYSDEALMAIAEFIMAFDICAKEPDETYGEVFISFERRD